MTSLLYTINRDIKRAQGAVAGTAIVFGGDIQLFEISDPYDPSDRRGSSWGAETSKDAFQIVQINDFTSEEIKAEVADIEDGRPIPVVEVCAARHGGPLDYPKAAPKSVVHVLEKWDRCYDQLEFVIRRRRPTRPVKPSMVQGVPKRKQENGGDSDEEVFNQLAGKERNEGGRSKSMKHEPSLDEDRVNEEEFHSAVSESSAKMLLHKRKHVKRTLADGEVKETLKIISGLSLIRNKLWHYNEYLQVHDKPRAFKDIYVEVCQLIDACSEQVLEYYCNLVATTVLHDARSNDWGNDRPFYEGEKVSHSVQHWWFFIQGIRSDLWKTLSPRAALKIYSAVFLDSLSILTSRYTKISPSPARLSQFRADVTSILLVATETLPSLVTSLDSLFMSAGGNMDVGNGVGEGAGAGMGGIVRDVHAKCSHLMTALAVVGTPIGHLAEALGQEKKPKSRRKKALLGEADKNIMWMHLIRPETFPDQPENLTVSGHLSLVSKLCSSQPEPSWPLVVQTMLCRDMAVARLVILHFGAFVPNVTWEAVETTMTEGCKGYGCDGECIGFADVFWPQAVGTGVMQVCMFGMRNPMALVNLMDPLLERLSKESWDTLSKNSVWNPKKPVCFQGIMHLLTPYIWPVLQELFDLIAAGKAWTLAHVPTAMKEVVQALQDIVPLVPIPVLHLLQHLDTLRPEEVKPVGGSALIHFFISTLYGLISRIQPLLRRRRLAKEKLDFVIAFGESLCTIENSKELLNIQVAAEETLASETSSRELPEHEFDHPTHPFSSCLSEMVGNEMLSTPDGALALKVLYRFICYNTEWIQSSLSSSFLRAPPLRSSSSSVAASASVSHPHPLSSSPSSSSLSASPSDIPVLIRPWGGDPHPDEAPHQQLNRIGRFVCDQGVFNCRNSVVNDNEVQGSSNNNTLSVPGGGGGGGGHNNNLGAPKLRYESIMTMQHQWDVYLKHVIAHGNPLLVDKLIPNRCEFRDDEDKSWEDEAAAKDLLDLWKRKKEEWTVVN